MERQVIKVRWDLIAWPPVAKVILSFPRWIDDKGIGPRKDLPREPASREERLSDLISLGCLCRIIDWIGEEASGGAEVLLDAMSVALQHRILEVERHVTGCSGGPVLALGNPMTAW
jgi:hypothetical protein